MPSADHSFSILHVGRKCLLVVCKRETTSYVLGDTFIFGTFNMQQAEVLFESIEQPTQDRWVLVGAAVVLVIALAIGIFADSESSQVQTYRVQSVTAIK